MGNGDYKKYSKQAKAGIKGEAFFETLVSDYSLPHHIVGGKDLGIDYICEWVYGDKPTGILYAVQVKTISAKNITLEVLGPDSSNNKLNKFRIKRGNPIIKERTLQYWRGLGMPVYLFVIVYAESEGEPGSLNCYYKRYTSLLTSDKRQEYEEIFYQVNNGASFLAFADKDNKKKYGFARDLYIDLMRYSYYKGSISYILPQTLGLQQFPDSEDKVFSELFEEYREKISYTYTKTKKIIECLEKNDGTSTEFAVSSAGPSDD